MKITLIAKDIKVDGLELAKEIYEEHPDCDEPLPESKLYANYLSILPLVEKMCNDEIARYSGEIKTIREKNKHISFNDDISIEVFFTPKNMLEKLACGFDISNDNCLGLMVNTGGEGIVRTDESFFNDKFQVVVGVENDHQLVQELDNDCSIEGILGTLTHELNHALLFLINSGGMTPEDVDCLYSCDEFDKSVNECMEGEEFIRKNNDLIGCHIVDEIEDPDELMEIYVEHIGMSFIEKLKLKG